MSKLIPYSSNAAKSKGSRSNESALDLVYNFLNEPLLRPMSDLSIGGTFPIKHFKLHEKCYAKQFWYCYSKNNRNPQHRVFLAMEDSWKGWPRNITVKQIPSVPEAKSLVRPLAPFVFDDKKYDRTNISDVSNFIQNHEDANMAVTKINASEVAKCSKAFVSSFGGKAKGFCHYPVGYFENFELESKRCYIDEFLNQKSGLEHVRYYFGLDTSKAHFPNRIRIVLFPIGSSKKTMSSPINTSGIGDILQASWPPPPPTQ